MPSIRLFAAVSLLTAAPVWAQPTLPLNTAGKMPDAIRPFVDRLYAANPAERAEAACQLGKRAWQSTVAIPILLSMLHDDVVVEEIECNMSPWLRRELRVNAEARQWSRTSPAKEAADTLAEIGDAAIPGLVQALKNADWRVRKFAALGLGEVDTKFDRPEMTAALSDTLRDIYADVRAQSAWALGEIEDDRAVGALVNALGDAEVRVRKQAAWALGEIESPAAVKGLVAALKDTAIEVRRQAAWALGEIEDASAISGLVAALADADADVRKQAAWALGEIEDVLAVKALIGALQDNDWQVRKTAAWALGEIEDASAIPALETARRDGRVEVREAAMHALRELRQ